MLEPLGNVLAGDVKTSHSPGQSAEMCEPLKGTNGIAPMLMSQPTMRHVGTAIATTAITMASGNIILRMWAKTDTNPLQSMERHPHHCNLHADSRS